jgi:hypothetical protein
MLVVGNKLPEPLQLPASDVEHDHRSVYRFFPIRALPKKSGAGLPTAVLKGFHRDQGR